MITDDMLRNDPLAEIDERSWSNGAHPLTPGENSWYSSFSEEHSNTEEFPQINRRYYANSSSKNILSPLPSAQTLIAESAFRTYTKANAPTAVAESSRSGQILQKRCFRFLSSIQKNDRKATQILSVNAAARNSGEEKSRSEPSIEHMMAERNRRTRLKQHFANLHALLPQNSKKDKNSILVNTTSYLTELKLQVGELKQLNKKLLKIIQKMHSNKSQRGNKMRQLDLVISPAMNDIQLDKEQNEEATILEWETILHDQVAMDGWLEEIL